jgi:hypothetical protein
VGVLSVSIKAPHVLQSDVPLDVFRISAMLVHFAARFDAEGQAEFFEALSSSIGMLRNVSKDTAIDRKSEALETIAAIREQQKTRS